MPECSKYIVRRMRAIRVQAKHSPSVAGLCCEVPPYELNNVFLSVSRFGRRRDGQPRKSVTTDVTVEFCLQYMTICFEHAFKWRYRGEFAKTWHVAIALGRCVGTPPRARRSMTFNQWNLWCTAKGQRFLVFRSRFVFVGWTLVHVVHFQVIAQA